MHACADPPCFAPCFAPQDLDYEVFLGNAAFGPSAKATAGVVARIPGQVGWLAAGHLAECDHHATFEA